MYVEESGKHCFLLSDTVFFYNHWGGDIVKKIDLFKTKYFAERDPNFKFYISCIAIKVIEDELFEVLLGTSTGHILHGCLLFEPKTGKLTIIENFNCLLELERGKPVLDISIVNFKNFIVLLAVNDTNLFQLVGKGTIVKETLLKYQQDPQLKESHC